MLDVLKLQIESRLRGQSWPIDLTRTEKWTNATSLFDESPVLGIRALGLNGFSGGGLAWPSAFSEYNASLTELTDNKRASARESE